MRARLVAPATAQRKLPLPVGVIAVKISIVVVAVAGVVLHRETECRVKDVHRSGDDCTEIVRVVGAHP